MNSNSPEDLKKAFNDAKARYRLVGVSGIETVGDLRGNIKENSDKNFSRSKDNVSVRKGVVTFGKMHDPQKNGELKSQFVQPSIQISCLEKDITPPSKS